MTLRYASGRQCRHSKMSIVGLSAHHPADNQSCEASISQSRPSVSTMSSLREARRAIYPAERQLLAALFRTPAAQRSPSLACRAATCTAPTPQLLATGDPPPENDGVCLSPLE